jgi:hypothetical protein
MKCFLEIADVFTPKNLIAVSVNFLPIAVRVGGRTKTCLDFCASNRA